MTASVLVPTLAGVTLIVAIVIGVFGIRGAKRAERDDSESALGHHGADVSNIDK